MTGRQPATTRSVAAENAKAWVRTLYGAEGRVSCVEDRCDVAIPQVPQPFTLMRSPTPRGACHLRQN